MTILAPGFKAGIRLRKIWMAYLSLQLWKIQRLECVNESLGEHETSNVQEVNISIFDMLLGEEVIDLKVNAWGDAGLQLWCTLHNRVQILHREAQIWVGKSKTLANSSVRTANLS